MSISSRLNSVLVLLFIYELEEIQVWDSDSVILSEFQRVQEFLLIPLCHNDSDNKIHTIQLYIG